MSLKPMILMYEIAEDKLMTQLSSPQSGVQTHIKASAPDADYQRCCLHSINLVICNSTKVCFIRNMFDSCQEAFLFFRNSPKRQRFLELVIETSCPEAKKMDYVKLGGWRGILHFLLYFSFIHTLSKCGKKCAFQAMMSSYMVIALGIGVQNQEALQMGYYTPLLVLSTLLHSV